MNKTSDFDNIIIYFKYLILRKIKSNLNACKFPLYSKQEKDWTRQMPKENHFICIEDPFDISYDLGRRVDKYRINVLREEFERAAEIMQSDPNPCESLLQPYVWGVVK